MRDFETRGEGGPVGHKLVEIFWLNLWTTHEHFNNQNIVQNVLVKNKKWCHGPRFYNFLKDYKSPSGATII